MGFEPTRAEHNGLAVHHLNLSATLSFLLLEFSHLYFEYTLVALKLWTDYDAQADTQWNCWSTFKKQIQALFSWTILFKPT